VTVADQPLDEPPLLRRERRAVAERSVAGDLGSNADILLPAALGAVEQLGFELQQLGRGEAPFACGRDLDDVGTLEERIRPRFERVLRGRPAQPLRREPARRRGVRTSMPAA
jgi:hypothetical protein